MSISVVQSGKGTDPGETGTSNVISGPFGSNNTAGDLLFSFLGLYGPTLASIGDSQGNSWVSVPNDRILTNNNLYARACLSCKAGANTIQGRASANGFFDFVYLEASAGAGFSWASDGGPFSVATGSGTAVASNNVTIAGSNTILIAYLGTGTHQTPAAPAGWTKLPSTDYGSSLYYKVVTSPGTYQFTVTITSDSWATNLWAFTASTAAAAATYYVDPAGNDANNGLSATTAWATLSKVNAHAFVPGDTILLKGGATFSGGIILTTSGTAANPITFNSYGTGVATISSPVSTLGFYGHNCGYVIVENINCIGPGIATANVDGVRFFVDQSNVTYNFIRITNVTAVGYYQGISVVGNSAFQTSPVNGYNDVRIVNCIAHDNYANGIIVGSANGTGAYSNVYIGYSTAYNNIGVPGVLPWTGSGIVIGQCNTGTIEYCSGYENGSNPNTTVQGSVGIWTFNSTAVTIQFCESYNNNSGNGVDGDGIDIDGGCTNCIIQYCYTHGNRNGGLCAFQYTAAGTWSGNIIRYCISENDGLGISIWGEAATNGVATNGAIYNNTIYNSVGPCLQFTHGDDGLLHITGFTITNNIFVTSGTKNLVQTNTSSGSAPGVTFANNDYHALGTFQISWMGTTYSTLSSWAQDSTGLTSDPLLNNPGAGGTVGNPTLLPTLFAYKIKSGSPMINAGATISSPGSQDFYGNALSGRVGTDIGAHQLTPLVGTPLSVLVYLPTGFNDNHRSRLGEDNYDSASADPTYVYDPYGPRPQTQSPF